MVDEKDYHVLVNLEVGGTGADNDNDTDNGNGNGPPSAMMPPSSFSAHKQIQPIRARQQQQQEKQIQSAGIPIMPPPPPPMMMMMASDPTGGTYHPDFMFCGACTTCQEPDPTKTELQEDEKLETYLDNPDLNMGIGDDSPKKNGTTVILKTKFHFRQPLGNKPSHGLVIQSLLQPIPGVLRVEVNATDNSFTVNHDASLNTESILSTLDSVGHSAFIQAPPTSTLSDTNSNSNPNPNPTDNNNMILVRSQFYVEGICCASEIPTIKRIVKPMLGVNKLQINLTTKIVHVHHDVTCLSASTIAKTLSKEGFPTTIQRDGQISAQAKQRALNHGRSTLHVVHANLTEQDIPVIQNILSSMKGVSKIGINVSENVIYVDHDIKEVTSGQCVEKLQINYECEVAVAAERAVGDATGTALDHIGRSKYVESTLSVPGLRNDRQLLRVVKKLMEQHFIRAQIRAVYPNVISETVKVEHDPKLVSILDVAGTLEEQGVKPIQILVNGGDLNMYLPLQEDYPNQQGTHSEDPSLLKIHANVWLSGIFWILSLLSYNPAWEWFKYFGIVSVVFGLPPIVAKAYRTICRCQFDANCMMVTAAVGALAIGEFDEAASVAFLFAVSEFLEARATMKARKALQAICNLRPDHANVIHPITKEIVVVPADRVPLGSLISVRTGDKIAADGIIVEGISAVDESSLTGEAKPAHKKEGDEVQGGTINIGTTQLVVKTTTTVDDSAVSRLIRLVEEAQSNRSPTEKMIDEFARSYTPTVALMAALMCTVPWCFGHETGREWFLNGLIIIVIACPCALTISTPVTYAAALAATARRGVICKGGSKLEAMGSVDKIVFDKTGTLTKGKFTVTHLEVVGTSKTRQEMLQLLALMQDRSSHPLSQTLVQAAKDEGVNVPRYMHMTGHTVLKGEGITANADGKVIYVGNQRLFDRIGMYDSLPLNYKDLVKAWSGSGGTIGFIGTDKDGIIGTFCVKDAVREEARATIQGFKDAHIDTMICTGDSDAAANAVAKEIGVAIVHSQLLPEDKLHYVGSLKRPQPKTFALCREKRYVLFCGDGVNDAPALAVADIGVSMGEGAAMALEMSDVTLMDSDLTKLSYAIKMGRRVLKTVKENIFLSLFAKLVVVALTFAGQMTLLFAITADVGIMLVVTLNGMKLLPGRFDPTGASEMTSLVRKRHKKKKKKKRNGEEEEAFVGVEMQSPTSAVSLDYTGDAPFEDNELV